MQTKGNVMRRVTGTAVLSGAVAAILLLVHPRPAALVRRLRAPGTSLRAAGTDALIGDLAASLLWLVAAWLALGLAATLLAAVPGSAGRAFDAASRRLLPAALRRLVAGSAGLGLLVAPIPATVAWAAPPPAQLAAAALPAPVWPGAPVPHADPGQPPTVGVRVQPGDSLWLIAARRLGPTARVSDIAASWPQWYAANRPVIGDDPDLIRPGQHLTPPPTHGADGAGR
jgi:nucleoid-associated protein YgaU